ARLGAARPPPRHPAELARHLRGRVRRARAGAPGPAAALPLPPLATRAGGGARDRAARRPRRTVRPRRDRPRRVPADARRPRRAAARSARGAGARAARGAATRVAERAMPSVARVAPSAIIRRMRYFEDFREGEVIELGSHRLTRDEIVEFARQWDPQPFHVSDVEWPFGGLIASGWHTILIGIRLAVD